MAIQKCHLEEKNDIRCLQRTVHCDTIWNETYTLWFVDPQFKTAADHVYAEAYQTVQHACRNIIHLTFKGAPCILNTGLVYIVTDQPRIPQPSSLLCLPVVEKMPPTMPQSRTRNCHSGMCCSVTFTIRELMSYFIKIPDTPWLPAAWFITRS